MCMYICTQTCQYKEHGTKEFFTDGVKWWRFTCVCVCLCVCACVWVCVCVCVGTCPGMCMGLCLWTCPGVCTCTRRESTSKTRRMIFSSTAYWRGVRLWTSLRFGMAPTSIKYFVVSWFLLMTVFLGKQSISGHVKVAAVSRASDATCLHTCVVQSGAVLVSRNLANVSVVRHQHSQHVGVSLCGRNMNGIVPVLIPGGIQEQNRGKEVSALGFCCCQFAPVFFLSSCKACLKTSHRCRTHTSSHTHAWCKVCVLARVRYFLCIWAHTTCSRHQRPWWFPRPFSSPLLQVRYDESYWKTQADSAVLLRSLSHAAPVFVCGCACVCVCVCVCVCASWVCVPVRACVCGYKCASEID